MFLAALLDNIADAVVSCDAKGVLTRFNESARTLHGLPEEPITPEAWADHYDLYQADGVTPMPKETVPLLRALQGERVRDAEMAVVPKDGTAHFLLANGQAMRDAGGQLLGAVVTMHDVTERKQAELSLHESEERWKFAIEGAGDGLWDWNIQTGVAFYSPRYKEMFGYVEADFGTTSDEWSKRIHPDDAPGVFAALRPYMEGKPGSAAVEFRMLCKDGGWKWTLGRGMVVSRDADGKPLRMIGTNGDITERKAEEDTLKASEQRFRDLVNTTDGIVWEADARTFQFTFISERAVKLLGFPAADWLMPGFWVRARPDLT